MNVEKWCVRLHAGGWWAFPPLKVPPRSVVVGPFREQATAMDYARASAGRGFLTDPKPLQMAEVVRGMMEDSTA